MTWLRSPRLLLVLALALGVALHFAAHPDPALTPLDSAIPAQADPDFRPAGWFPGEPLAHAPGVRAWGSWNGSDQNTGTLRLGPFPAPRTLRLALGGYLATHGNSLRIDLVGTDERTFLSYASVGERWAICDIDLPAAWQNRPIVLVASDCADTYSGWFAVTEPIRGGQSDGAHARLKTFSAWLINGALLGVLYLAAAQLLAARTALAPHWLPLAAATAVALCAYLTYWAYHAHPWLGWSVSIAALLASLLTLRRPTPDHARPDLAAVTTLLVAFGACTLALLHLFPTGHEFYTLTAHRFHHPPAVENSASYFAAGKLFAGQPAPAASPLHTGAQLLTWPVAKLFTLDRRTWSGTATLWLQLLWIPAAFAVLRALSVPARRATAWTLALGLVGWIFYHTTAFAPAFLAGALATAAAALCLLAPTSATIPTPRFAAPRHLLAAVLAALALVTDASAALPLLALVPLLLLRAARHPRSLASALLPAAVFVLLVLPALIQRPENLAAWQLSSGEKLLALPRHFLPDLPALLDLSSSHATDRRTAELFTFSRALTLWPILALFAVTLTARRVLAGSRDLARFALWLAATALLGALLSPATPTPLPLFLAAAAFATLLLCAALQERAHPAWLLVCASLQALTFATTWPLANEIILGLPTGLPLVLATAAPLAWLVLRSLAPSAASTAAYSLPATRYSLLPPAWWHAPRLNVWVVLAIAFLFFLRKPDALHTPQLWAEDGNIFLTQNDLLGPAALLEPYMGYLHTLPRLIAFCTALVSDPAAWPALYNGVSFLIWVAVALRFFSARFAFPGKPWLAFALVAVPHTGEVFFNITNLQWLTAFVLIQQAVIAAPVTRAQRVSDCLILALVTVTGPFGLAFLPLFFLRWLFAAHRDELTPSPPSPATRYPRLATRYFSGLFHPAARHALAPLLTVAACALIQAWFVRSGPRFDFQSAPFHLWPNLVILARRLLVWPLLGHDAALALSPAVIGLVGTTLFSALTLWALRPDPLRRARLHVLAALALITVAAVYRTRPDTWAADNLNYGDRYFYIPRVLLLWLVIWEFHARPRLIALLARSACLLFALVHVRDFTLPAPPNYHWARHVEPIRRGVPAEIPILPENWTMEYLGRPNR